MSTADVAEFLNVPIQWVHNNMKRLPPSFRPGRTHRWQQQDIKAWLEGTRVAGPPYLDVR